MATVFDPESYCSDEDLARRARSDYAMIVSDDETLAAGSDGSFDQATPWLLSSASIDFEAQGVLPGAIALLSGRHTQPVAAPTAALGVGGQRLVADFPSANTLTLRRVGQLPAVGQPPGRGGLTGVVFKVCTLMPQVVDASGDIRRTLAYDAPTETLITADDLRELCVLWVLAELFLDKTRLASGSGMQAANVPYGADVFALKYSIYAKQRDQLLDELRSRRVPMDATDSFGVVPILPRRHFPWNVPQ